MLNQGKHECTAPKTTHLISFWCHIIFGKCYEQGMFFRGFIVCFRIYLWSQNMIFSVLQNAIINESFFSNTLSSFSCLTRPVSHHSLRYFPSQTFGASLSLPWHDLNLLSQSEWTDLLEQPDKIRLVEAKLCYLMCHPLQAVNGPLPSAREPGKLISGKTIKIWCWRRI